MSSTDFQSDLDVAVAAARAAGEVVLHHFRAGVDVRYKSPTQPVTVADLAANDLLHRILTAARPEYGWLSEESADSAERLDRSRVWVIDPIDGTNSFVEGLPEFVVSVGLVEGGRPVAAALLNPATGELFQASRGAGAFLDGRRIHVAGPARGRRPRLVVSRAELAAGEFAAFADRWEILPLGSTAYRMLKVADGAFDAFFSRKRKHEWDVCAAALVVEEAGGTVSQLDGTTLHFNQTDPVFRGIVAAGGTPPEPTLLHAG
ncbi:MAG TPA: 3'(2'),5'-bisphosphate nucleotidase CysQ [Longimicrobiaceae bacterium]|nr:3'(2'),5'-bisphosphate nucleotidase CysQ [Longimicrobiaceae bacterium]